MQILHDVFPAYVAVAQEGTLILGDLHSSPRTEGTYGLDKARVIITPERIIIANDSNEGPVIVFSEEYSEFNKSGEKNQDSHVITKTGKMLAYRKNSACGCGSRLRAWNPYRHVYSSKDPSE